MKKLIFLFCITFGIAQNNGIRSLNGSLNNSQRLTIDTTSSATFRWGLSNGVHTLYLPYRIVNPSSGSFKWNVSGQTAKYDSLRLIAGSNVSLTQSGNTVTIATSGGGSVGNADSLGGQPASDYARLSVANTFTDNNTFAKDTNYFGSSGNNAVVNFWDEALGQYAPITMQESEFNFGGYSLKTTDNVYGSGAVFSSSIQAPTINQEAGGSQLKLAAGNPYSILGGQDMTKEAAIGYVNVFGTKIHVSRQTTGGFAYANVKDTIFYGHATISHNVPFVASESNDSTANEESSQLWMYSRRSGDTASFALGLLKSRDGYAGTHTLFLRKYRGLLDANNGRWDYNKYVQIWSTDSSNNFRFNSTKASTESYGSVFIDNGNFTVSNGSINGGAITATGLMTLGAGGTAQAHQISSNSANALTLYRPISTNPSAASGLNFAGQTSNGTQVTYATIQGLAQSLSNSLQSGGLTFASRRAGTEVRAVIIDSLTNVGLQIQNTSTLSDSRFWIRSSGLSLYALSVIPAASTTKQFAVDTSGRVPIIGGLTTSGAYGLAPIVDTITYGAVSSTIASRNLPSTAGTYRINYFMAVNTAGTGGTVQATISYNNGVARTLTTASLNLTLTTESDNNAFIYKVTSGTPTIVVTITGATGSPVYSFDAVVERLK